MSVRAIERLWGDEGWRGRLGRGVLAPASWGYGVVGAARNALYDRGVLPSHEAPLPVLSIGNLSVGGTGKTPMAAWAVARLRDAGARPAVVMRGYGDDEPLVHARLNPGAIVIADPDRVRGVARARAEGADCAILDDGFQHRRLRRTADWVLVSAEQWRPGLRLLPAGPLRESAGSLRRADLLIVTRKSASRERADGVVEQLAGSLRTGARVAVCHLAPFVLVEALTARQESLSWLSRRTVLAVAAVGTPSAFFAQVASLGATVEPLAFGDHHAFDAADVARIVRAGTPRDGVVCTLKDAVKLAPLWPRAGPTLWYVSQRAVVERGSDALDASLEGILAARPGATSTAGSAGQSASPHGHRSSTAD